MQTCMLARLGLMDYLRAWDVQKSIALRRGSGCLSDILVLVEHPHTYTMGRRGKISDVLLSETTLNRMGISVCYVDRGGEVTYHGPGQIVGYPIVDVRSLGGPVKYVRTLESVLTRTLSDFGLEANRLENSPGVWVGEEKIAAIGVKIARGITTHGFALNVNPDLAYFEGIVPCGVKDMRVTSIEKLLERPVRMDDVAMRVAYHFGVLFDRSMEEVSASHLIG